MSGEAEQPISVVAPSTTLNATVALRMLRIGPTEESVPRTIGEPWWDRTTDPLIKRVSTTYLTRPHKLSPQRVECVRAYLTSRPIIHPLETLVVHAAQPLRPDGWILSRASATERKGFSGVSARHIPWLAQA